jgi:hypothetical protein
MLIPNIGTEDLHQVTVLCIQFRAKTEHSFFFVLNVIVNYVSHNVKERCFISEGKFILI